MQDIDTDPDASEENIFQDMTFDEILEDLNARFLINLPREEMSLVRVYWQAEQASVPHCPFHFQTESSQTLVLRRLPTTSQPPPSELFPTELHPTHHRFLPSLRQPRCRGLRRRVGGVLRVQADGTLLWWDLGQR